MPVQLVALTFRCSDTASRESRDLTGSATSPGGSLIGGRVHRGASGDPRGSSQNNLVIEFLGDYVYAVAGNSYATATWNDVRDAGDCPAIDAWRAGVQTPTPSDDVAKPAPQAACTTTFSNTDIFGWTSAP